MNRIFVHAPDLSAVSLEHSDSVKTYEYMQMADGSYLIAVEPEKVAAAERLARHGVQVLQQTDSVSSLKPTKKGKALGDLLPGSWSVQKTDSVQAALAKIHLATGNHAFNPAL